MAFFSDFSCLRPLLAGFASGLAGFAMGFVVSGVWLHLITPIETTTLIVGYSFWTQGYGVWKLRRSLSWRNVAPFIIAGSIGVPLGTLLLNYINPDYLRLRRWSFAGGLRHLRPDAASVEAGGGRDRR